MSPLRSLGKVLLRFGINSPTREKNNYGIGLENMFNAGSGARLSKATETSFRAVKTIFTTEFSMKEHCGQPDFTHMVGRLVGWLVGPSAVNILIREVRV